MIEGAAGGAGGFYYLIYCSVVIALTVKKLPCGGNNFALGISIDLKIIILLNI